MNRQRLFRDFLIANIMSGIGILIMFFGLLLQRWKYLPTPPCLFLQATHMYCPGCGGTRALFAMLNGQLLTSFLYNPAVLLGAVLILHYELGVIITLLVNNGKYYYCRNPWPVYVYIGIVLGFAVVRNILLAGFGIDLLS